MSDSEREEIPLVGQLSTFNVVFDLHPDREKQKSLPLICCSAPAGFSRLDGFLKQDLPKLDQIEAFASWISRSVNGRYVAVLDVDVAGSGLALIQEDASSGTGKDFYFRAVYTAVSQADEVWSAPEIELAHPVLGEWNPTLLTVVLEALGYLADRKKLALSRVHLGCLHGVTMADFREAVSLLNDEQSGRSRRPVFTPFDVERVDLPELYASDLPGTQLFRIPPGRRKPGRG